MLYVVIITLKFQELEIHQNPFVLDFVGREIIMNAVRLVFCYLSVI
jgi:hypothetical protein